MIIHPWIDSRMSLPKQGFPQFNYDCESSPLQFDEFQHHYSATLKRQAILLFLLLSYAHFIFTRNPPSCLEHIRPLWPRNGILYVQVHSGAGSYVSTIRGDDMEMQSAGNSNGLPASWNVDFAAHPLLRYLNFSTAPQLCYPNKIIAGIQLRHYKPYERSAFYHPPVDENDEKQDNDRTYLFIVSFCPVRTAFLLAQPDTKHGDFCAVEYAMEYGLLRLSEETRDRLKIPIMYVSLDPTKEVCFGKAFNQFLIRHVFGYDMVVMTSIKSLVNDYAEKGNIVHFAGRRCFIFPLGFLRNLITGEQYRFVTMWMSRTSYLTAFMTMIVLTFSISVLLRFSHQQIFMLIVQLFHVFEFNGVVTVPLAPLISVILGLIGMEAVMAEFFIDANIGFFVILIVWVADQYDSICCTSAVSRRFWLKYQMRFFYLYHFMFYAYYSRFNGQFSYLALLSCWIWTLHSMVYFFHHYELPLIMRHLHFRNFVAHIEADPQFLAEATQHVRVHTHVRHDIRHPSQRNVAHPVETPVHPLTQGPEEDVVHILHDLLARVDNL
ncbi:membralin [Trichuris trichiura]|uniref:Membralin n=1 Tax=Trichuris trichiura TaxID=36087 RepID=A0A077Z176_TRITR|nr:membralin [Trichuris trichiura]